MFSYVTHCTKFAQTLRILKLQHITFFTRRVNSRPISQRRSRSSILSMLVTCLEIVFDGHLFVSWYISEDQKQATRASFLRDRWLLTFLLTKFTMYTLVHSDPAIVYCFVITAYWTKVDKNDSGSEINLSLTQNLAMRNSENRGFVQKSGAHLGGEGGYIPCPQKEKFL